MRVLLLAAFLALSTEAICAPTRVYEGTKTLLAGPYDEKTPPRDRPDAFSPVEHHAVYLENDYLRCCLLPRAGGRIYEVYHKPSKSQLFHTSPYLETLDGDGPTSHEWNLGGLEINFPYLGHATTYNDVWQWAPVRDGTDLAGVVMAHTSRRTMQRVVLRVLLRPDSARLDLTYRFENLSPLPWGLSSWINVAPAVGASSRWILPAGWVEKEAPGRSPELRFWGAPGGPQESAPLETLTRNHGATAPGRTTFAGVYDPVTSRGLARIFDPATLPVMKLAASRRPELRARVDAETSTLTDGLWRRPELSAHEARESWYPIWSLDGCVLVNEDLALHVDRPARGRRVGRDVVLGICASQERKGCVVTLVSEHEALYRTTIDLDPARPWKKIVPAPPGPILVEVLAPDGRRLARYEMRGAAREQAASSTPDPGPPTLEPDPIADARRDELLEALERRPDRFLEESIRRYAALLRRAPHSAPLMVDLARSYLRDAQLRAAADDSVKPPIGNFQKAHDLLQEVVKRDRRNSRARFYLGLALEGLGKPANAAGEYRAALKGVLASPASGLYLAHTVIRKSAKDALEAARVAASAYPESRRARHMLMVALNADGKAKEAVAIGRELYRLDPADPLTTELLSESLKAAKELREATRFEEETTRLIADDEATRRCIDQDLEWLHGLNVKL